MLSCISPTGGAALIIGSAPSEGQRKAADAKPFDEGFSDVFGGFNAGD